MTIDHISRYGHYQFTVRDDTEVGVGDVHGDGDNPFVVAWFGHVQLRGDLDTVADRLQTLCDLLDRVRDHPELRDLLLARRARQQRAGPRQWMHPFRDPPGPVPPTRRPTP